LIVIIQHFAIKGNQFRQYFVLSLKACALLLCFL